MDEPQIVMGRVEALPGGGARLHLGPVERLLLQEAFDELEARLAAPDPATRRLFPPAYPDDEDAEADYRAMTAGELLDGRQTRLVAVRGTIDADELTPEQVEAWVGVLNDLRLTIGSQLDVRQDEGVPDEDDPRHEPYIRYLYLGWLQEQFVDVASATLLEE